MFFVYNRCPERLQLRFFHKVIAVGPHSDANCSSYDFPTIGPQKGASEGVRKFSGLGPQERWPRPLGQCRQISIILITLKINVFVYNRCPERLQLRFFPQGNSCRPTQRRELPQLRPPQDWASKGGIRRNPLVWGLRSGDLGPWANIAKFRLF